MILYEYPFNERIRTYLRLEQLLLRLRELVGRSHAIDHHHAIQTLFELAEIGQRSDLKAEMGQALARQQQKLQKYQNTPGISEQVLYQLHTQIENCQQALQNNPMGSEEAWQGNALLQSIRQRDGIAGGTCAFDLPSYHEWLHRPAASRQADLQHWSQHLHSLHDSLQLLLKLLRDSGMPQKMLARQGVLEYTLPTHRAFKLLRLQLPPSFGLVPEIEGTRLKFRVQLLRSTHHGEPQAVNDDVPLEITLCT